MIVRSTSPYNAEPTLATLRASTLTSQGDFYIRSHGEVPQLDGATHSITVAGLVNRPLSLSVRELQSLFQHHSVTAVMQCAGNRRADLQPVGATTGDPWAPGAIGNARWTGVRLADVLQAAGAETGAHLHVAFEAGDIVEIPSEGRFAYGASIPMTKAVGPEVLLAWAMNDEALAPEHGFPLRVVVPGYAGVRSPKWLASITVQAQPSSNHMQQRDYKLFPPEITVETVDWTKGVTIDAMPLNSAICDPAPNASLPAGPTLVRGYAIATNRDIVRVDLSDDGGLTWIQAEIEAYDEAWSWRFWNATIDLRPGRRELSVRAWDSAGQTQPARANDVWNFKGYLCASWHRIPVTVT